MNIFKLVLVNLSCLGITGSFKCTGHVTHPEIAMLKIGYKVLTRPFSSYKAGKSAVADRLIPPYFSKNREILSPSPIDNYQNTPYAIAHLSSHWEYRNGG